MAKDKSGVPEEEAKAPEEEAKAPEEPVNPVKPSEVVKGKIGLKPPYFEIGVDLLGENKKVLRKVIVQISVPTEAEAWNALPGELAKAHPGSWNYNGHLKAIK